MHCKECQRDDLTPDDFRPKRLVCKKCVQKQHGLQQAQKRETDPEYRKNVNTATLNRFKRRLRDDPAFHEHVKERKCKQNLRRRIRVLQIYGLCCAGCGTDELAVLTIDHKNDDGAEERKGVYHHSYFTTLLKNPKRSDLQTLCWNCQFRKRLYGPDFSTWKEKMESYSVQSLLRQI